MCRSLLLSLPFHSLLVIHWFVPLIVLGPYLVPTIIAHLEKSQLEKSPRLGGILAYLLRPEANVIKKLGVFSEEECMTPDSELLHVIETVNRTMRGQAKQSPASFGRTTHLIDFTVTADEKGVWTASISHLISHLPTHCTVRDPEDISRRWMKTTY
jgi:hypothetical protein